MHVWQHRQHFYLVPFDKMVFTIGLMMRNEDGHIDCFDDQPGMTGLEETGTAARSRN